MRTERVEVRLDTGTRGKLEKVAAARGSSVSEVVRAMIDRLYEEELAKERLEAARRIGEMKVEEVPEAGELKRQLVGAHEPFPG